MCMKYILVLIYRMNKFLLSVKHFQIWKPFVCWKCKHVFIESCSCKCNITVSVCSQLVVPIGEISDKYKVFTFDSLYYFFNASFWDIIEIILMYVEVVFPNILQYTSLSKLQEVKLSEIRCWHKLTEKRVNNTLSVHSYLH